MQGRHLSPHLRPLPLESANTRPRRSNQAQAEPGRGEELRYDNFKVTGQEKEGRGGEVHSLGTPTISFKRTSSLQQQRLAGAEIQLVVDTGLPRGGGEGVGYIRQPSA